MTILAACSPGEVSVAVVEDGTLLDYALWRPGRPDGVGDVHRGRISAVMPGLAGAFVALDGADGFLPDTAGAAGRGVGDAVAVQVVRAAQGGKGPRLASVEEAPGSGPPRLIRPGPNPIERLAARYDGAIEVDDPAVAAALRATLGERVQPGRAVPDAVQEQIEALRHPQVALPGGLWASITPTPALVAIDVDTAGASGAAAGRAGKATLQDRLNRAMLSALAGQIRLRNLSGAILLDVAGMTVRRRAGLADALRAALAPDPLQPRFLGFTALGLAEIMRPRIHPPLHEVLAGPHAAGLAALRRLTREVGPGRKLALRAAPDVTRALQDDAAALQAMALHLTYPLALRSDPSLPPCTWVLEEKPLA